MFLERKDFAMQNNQTRGLDSDFYAPTDLFAAAAVADERAGFITKTYLYLFGAIAALVAIETILFTTLGDSIKPVAKAMMGTPISWLIVLGAFMAVSWIANKWAMNSTSSAMQHAGLGLCVAAWSVLLLPLLCIALEVGGVQLVFSAATATAGLFALLTLTVFITRKDFSFMRSFLMFGGFAALGFIATALLFGFTLGPIFMYAMIAFMCCYILYDTSNVLHHYRIGQHVAASLALFASVVTLFWYILQLFLSREE